MIDRAVAIIGLSSLILLGRRLQGAWTGPVVFLVGPFLCIMIVQGLLAPDFYFDSSGAGVLVAFATAYVLGIGMTIGQSEPEELKPEFVVEPGPFAQLGLVLFPFGAVIFCALTWYLVRKEGLGLGVEGIFYREDFLREVEHSAIGIPYRLLQIWMYVGAVPLIISRLAGVRRATVALVVYSAAVLVQGGLTVTKMGILVVVMEYLSAWAVFQRICGGRVSWRRVIGFLLGGLFTVAIMLTIMVLRYGGHVLTAPWFLRKMIVFAASGPSALAAGLESPDLGLGEHGMGMTLMGPLEVLGLAKRTLGAFEPIGLDSGYIGSISNVYTGYRFLIEDLGIAGAIAAMGLFGMVAGALWSRVRWDATWLRVSMLIAVLIWALWMPVAVMSYYNVWYVIGGQGLWLGLFLRMRRVEA